MGVYASNVVSGVVAFPFIAFLLTLPYMMVQYRKLEAVPFWKSFVFYALVFYLICAYFMVILPLPEALTAAEAGVSSKAPSLTPFLFVPGFIHAAQTASLSLLDPHSWIAFLKQNTVYCTLFNVLLTMPLGAFARYMFRMKWWQALVLGFCTSLFFELSQLTGLWGIYDYAYRLFDVDDLIVNTAGCMLGYAIMGGPMRYLPDFHQLDVKAAEKGARSTSFTRRLIGFSVDFILANVVAAAGCALLLAAGIDPAYGSFLPVYIAASGIFFILIPCLDGGQTLGHKVVRVHVCCRNGQPASRGQIFMRYCLFVWIFLMAPMWLLFLLALVPAQLYDGTWLMLIAQVVVLSSAVWLLSVAVRAVRSAMGHPFLLVFGAMTNTTVMTDGPAPAAPAATGADADAAAAGPAAAAAAAAAAGTAGAAGATANPADGGGREAGAASAQEPR